MENLIFLHGAMGSSEQFNPLLESLNSQYAILAIDLNGHGGYPFTSARFSIHEFAEEVLNRMNSHNLQEANVFGYSMGGFIGLYLALHYPQRIKKVMTLATKFQWDEQTADRESKMLDPNALEKKVPAFAAELSKRHTPVDWKELMHRTACLLKDLGKANPLTTADLSRIHQPVCLMIGDRDKMVSLDETLGVYRLLANASLAVLPDTTHPIEKVGQERLKFEILRFFKG